MSDVSKRFASFWISSIVLRCSMPFLVSVIIIVLAISFQIALGEEATENTSALQSIRSGMQDVVLHTIAWCPEIFGFPANNDIQQNIICKVLLKLQNLYKEEHVQRAYYGGPAYHTYVSGFEPMTLLAGLAFLAFLLQTLHALLYRAPATATLAPVSISRGSVEPESKITDTVLSALEKYDTMNEKRSLEDETTVLWPPLIKKMYSTLSSYWKKKNSLCKQNILCRLLRRQTHN